MQMKKCHASHVAENFHRSPLHTTSSKVSISQPPITCTSQALLSKLRACTTMRGTTPSALRNVQSAVSRAKPGTPCVQQCTLRLAHSPRLAGARPLSASACCRDASKDAESSTAPSRPGKGQAYPDESQEDAFRRNLREVQAWRRRKEAMRESRTA